jgi:hypothetical protein
VRVVRLEEYGAEGRAERQRNEAGDDRRGRNRHRELTEKQSGNTGEKGRRYEDRAERQCDRYQRPANFVHRSMGGFQGRRDRCCRKRRAQYALRNVYIWDIAEHPVPVRPCAGGWYRRRRRRIREHPLVSKDIPIYGYIYDVYSGNLVEVTEATKAGRPR